MRKFTLIAALICMSITSAFAGHVDTYGIGAKATSMGGAMTAGSDDPFSIYYNPAAMTRIKRPTFAIGVTLIDPKLTIDEYNVEQTSAFPINDLNGEGIDDAADLLKVPHFAYVHPVNDKLALGVAFYIPYGLDLKWDDNPVKNPAAYNTFHSYYLREVITPSVAYKVTDKLSFGAGIAIGKSKAGNERRRYVPDFMTNSTYMTAAFTAQYTAQTGAAPSAALANMMGSQLASAYAELQDAEYKMEFEDNFNYSFNFGVLYEFNDKLSFGATFRTMSETDMKGDTEVTPSLQYWSNEEVEGNVSIDTPNQLSLGVEYKVTPKWRVNFDMTRTWWSRVKSYTVEFEENFMETPNISDGAEEEHFERRWKDTWQYRFGTEYKLNETVDLRFGYYYDPTVVPDHTFDVLWPDSDKHVFSTGVGLNFERTSWDFAVQYIKIEPIHVVSGDSENLDHSYSRDGIHDGEVEAYASGNLWSYSVTFSYKF
jgi:long-chain fatty acid transport protein